MYGDGHGRGRRERATRRRFAALVPVPVPGPVPVPETVPVPASDVEWKGPRTRSRPWERWHAKVGEGAVLAWAAAIGALLAGFVLVGGLMGLALGVAAAYGVRRWQRHRQAVGGRTGQAGRLKGAALQIPLAADLLTACLAAGAGPHKAAEAVGKSLGGPVGERLAQAAAELRLGGEPAAVWGRMGALPGASGLARSLERAGTTGAPAVEPVSRLAADCRAEQGREASRRAERASVLATAPLGVCFLPAFLLIGVAPVMIGLVGGLASGK